MKSFDTIGRPDKSNPNNVLDLKEVESILKKSRKASPNSNVYYFYRVAQIVLTFWIVTVFVIIAEPWLNYWIKSAINHQNGSQILGESLPSPTLSVSPSPIAGVATFYLKNSKIEINAPIIEGIGEDSLSKGIGHHPDSVWPNQKGNVVLAGHNTDLNPNNPYAKVFFKLRDVSVGDMVTINYEGKNHDYQVFKSQTVSPTDTSLFQNVDDWMLTFYTCDPPYTDWKRLVFQAKLEKIE
jgi:LPXTG-site transpeptidase (sortase) family protein